jgi:hypothetical protein
MGTRTLPHRRTVAGVLAAQRFERPRAQTLLVTRLRTIKNVAVTVPNGTVLGSQVINDSTLTGSRGLVLHTSGTTGYDTWRRESEFR